ncbi:MAG TPA: flagellar motor protein MotB [Bryobacteraceae bacterium]|nr:flagellar motor protein MotB [Bryobacteraceae bacterium]
MTDQPVIVVKKKRGHGSSHHGGAWKVAYADFVTAMMAFFIVLWLMNSSEKVQKAVGGYFRDPSGRQGASGSGQAGLGEGLAIGQADLHKIKEKLEISLKEAPQLKQLQDQITMTVTGEGLRIELLESDKGTFFESGNSRPTQPGSVILKLLAVELGKLKNGILVEGHTDAKPFASLTSYSNWELSADRANAVRRLMQEEGLRPAQIAQIRGYADQKLRRPREPFHASNRRISIVVQWQSDPGKQMDSPLAIGPGLPVQIPQAAETGPSAHNAPQNR